MQKLILGVLGVLWSAAFFVLGLHLTFPSDELRDQLVYQVDSQTRGDMLLDLADTSPWRVTGVTLEEPKLYAVPKGRRGEEPVPELLVQMDSLSARALPSKLLGGTIGVAYDAELYGGDVVGTLVQDDTVSTIDAEIDGVDLARYPFDFEGGSLDMSGTIEGVIDVVFDGSDVDKSKGKLELEFPDLAIGEGSQAGGFDLPPMTFSVAKLAFDIDDGVATLDEGEFSSDVLEAEISGEIELSMPLKRSRLALDVELRLLDEKLATLADLYGDMKRAKTEDGAYLGSAIGTMERPSWRWTRASSSSSRASTLRTPRVDFDPVETEDDAEARRAERQERIRERRERLEAEQGEEGRRVRPSDDEYDDEEYDDEEFEDDEEYEDDEEFLEEEFERASPPRRLPGAHDPLSGGGGPIGLPEPDYEDVPPPDFSNDLRPEDMD